MALKGSILFDKLCELKYPEIHKFNPTSIDWLFDNEDSLYFLNWFCSAVQPSNLLSNSELHGLVFFIFLIFKGFYFISKIEWTKYTFLIWFSRFEKLKQDGITILEGKRLAEALSNQSDMMGEAEIETQIQQLQMQKENLVDQKQKLIKQFNWLK